MRRLLLLASLLLWVHSACAQSVRYQSQVIGSRGTPLANQNVAICTQPANTSTQPCSPLATLATSTSTTSGGANPLTTDVNGNFFFYAAPGTYTVQIYGPQISTAFVQPDTLVGATGPASFTNLTVSGTGTFNNGLSVTAGTTSISGALSVNTPSNIVSSVVVANPGAFANTQMNELVESDVNGCNAKTEFQAVQGGTNFSTDALSGCISVPALATEHNVNAVAGYANNSSSSQGAGGTTGGYFQCRALTNSSKCEGLNAVFFDTAGITTGGAETGIEIDFQPQNAASVYSNNTGLQVNLFAPNSTGNYGNAISVSNAQTGTWSTGIFINNGAVSNSGTWLQVSPNGTATSGANFTPPSQRHIFSLWNGSAPVSAEYDVQFGIGSGANPGFDSMFITHSGSPGSNSFGVKSPVNFAMQGTNGVSETFTLSNSAPASNGTITVPVATTGLMPVGGANLLMSPTAPTIAAAGCGGAAASIVVSNGTAAFKVNVGTTPTSACTFTFPAATTGWNVTCNDITTQSTSVFVQKQTGAESTTSVTITNFNDVAVATAFVASDVLKCTASAD